MEPSSAAQTGQLYEADTAGQREEKLRISLFILFDTLPKNH